MSKVELISHTLTPISLIVKAARTCQNSLDKSDTTVIISPKSLETAFINQFWNPYIETLGPNDEKLLRHCIEHGHNSIFEHVKFTFKIQLSRVAHIHLIRHRISSFSAESQRHVRQGEFFTPETIRNGEKAMALYMCEVEACMDAYDKLSKFVPIEDARYVLPMCMEGPMIYTGNLSSIRHAIAERTCKHAQKEIRDIFWTIKHLISEICEPLLYKCEKFHTCPDKCGKCVND